MITIRTYCNHHARDGAIIALAHQLYVPGWMLSKYLRAVIAVPQTAKIALAVDDDQPVAIVIVRVNDHTAAFCRQSHRRRGLATRCLDELRRLGATPKYAATGIVGSESFWYKNDIPVSLEGVHV